MQRGKKLTLLPLAKNLQARITESEDAFGVGKTFDSKDDEVQPLKGSAAEYPTDCFVISNKLNKNLVAWTPSGQVLTQTCFL